MRASILTLVVLAAACGGSAQSQPVTGPDWLSGYWLSCEGGQTAESWIGAGSGTLMGVNLSQSAEGGGYEFLRIAANEAGGLSYYSMPGGRSPPTEFAMVSNAGQRAVFENPAHDFPQRIIYAREGEMMIARIEDMGATQGMEWSFRRAELDANCAG